jgi:hypothetical protein
MELPEHFEEQHQIRTPYLSWPYNCPLSNNIVSTERGEYVPSESIIYENEVENEPGERRTVPRWYIRASRDSFSSRTALIPSYFQRHWFSEDSASFYEEDEQELVIDIEDELTDEIYEIFSEVGMIVWESMKDTLTILTQGRILPLRIIDKYLECSQSNKLEFIAALPPLDEIIAHMTNEESWANLLIKIIIDIYDDFLKENDGPLYATYQKDFLPLAIQFYSQCRSVSDMNFRIKALVRATGARSLLMFQRTGKDYVNYYKTAQRRIERQTEGLGEDQFYI